VVFSERFARRTAHQLGNFFQGYHRRIAGSGHGQRAVSRATFDRPLGSLPGQKTVDQPRGKGVAASNPIEDFQVLPVFRLVKSATLVANRTPVVPSRGFRIAKRSGDDLEGKFRYHLLDHLFEGLGLDVRDVFIESCDIKTKAAENPLRCPA